MSDEFTRMFQAMIAQGQEMVRAFNAALEDMKVKGFDSLFPTMSKDMM